MVILFKGTDKSKNYAPQAISLCAGLAATKYLKKTLLLQLTTKYPVEKYLIGKRVGEQSIDDNKYIFEDTGMDSLTRRAGVKSFTESHFANAVVPAVSSENLFDILKVSKKVEGDVAREVIQDPESVGAIIRSAERIYDNIFVLCDGKAGKVVEAVLPYIDRTVTCISQGKKEEISAPSSESSFLLVTNYDYKSQFSAHHMQKVYGVKKIYTMPYNVDFKDYYTNENMIQFILSNTEPEKSDYSYHLISEMSKLTKALIDEEEMEEDSYRFTKKTVARYANEKAVLDGDNVKVEVTEKEFLKPSKTLVHVSVNEKFKEEEEPSREITELDPKKLKKIKAEKRKENFKSNLSNIKNSVISKTNGLLKKKNTENTGESSENLKRKEA
ncbi:hypothetical protein [Butyrivibrio sp. AC2005]|uniref:hypothetical protein n=1 Tax=Butyrivibrio sp. AC2005 TaxID=1280672 RepID=UPI0003F98457|nr:hypothetical protein [Butyrivibrio sp. AC2005]